MKQGYLEIEVFTGDQVLPIRGSSVLVKDESGSVIYRLTADENGHTDTVALECPDKNNTVVPGNGDPPFAEYDIEIPPYNGYMRVIIHGVQIFEDITTILPVEMHPTVPGAPPEENIDEIFIPKEHGVDMPKHQSNRADFENYAAGGIAAAQVPLANEVQIPDYITVHLGLPNASARNVRIPFKEYIKNVASSEIFPTWEESAIIANVYCQISFALNRIYTVMSCYGRVTR